MRTQTSLLSLEARVDVLDQAVDRARRTGRPALLALGTNAIAEGLRDRLIDAPASPKIAWTNVSSGTRFLGLAQTDALRAETAEAAWEAPDLARDLLEQAVCAPEWRDELRVFGGIAFDPASDPHPAWPDGLPARFVLPQVLLYERDGESRILLTGWALPEDSSESLSNRFEQLLEDVERAIEETERPDMPRVSPVGNEEAHERWFAQVRAALARIEAGDVTKVVLSRDLHVRAEAPFPLGAVMRGLEANATSGTVFGFQFDSASAFVGATPELLVSVRGDQVNSDCLAGTTRRTGDPAEDARLALALLTDDKERREHEHVIAAVKEALVPLCESFDVPETPTLMVLPTLQHLHSPAQGRLREGVSLGTIVRRLHPTPAVGGTPRAEAFELIRSLEERPRGWYAGAIGWISPEAARFSVGIRSGILHAEGAVVFGGCGIVSGSDPAAEWEETQRKAATLLDVLMSPDPRKQGRSSRLSGAEGLMRGPSA